jgi:hypothetical protein
MNEMMSDPTMSDVGTTLIAVLCIPIIVAGMFILVDKLR